MRIPVLVAVYFHATCLSKVTMDNGLTQITIRTLGWLKILSLKKFIQVINTFQKYYLIFVLYKTFVAQKIIFLWKKNIFLTTKSKRILFHLFTFVVILTFSLFAPVCPLPSSSVHSPPAVCVCMLVQITSVPASRSLLACDFPPILLCVLCSIQVLFCTFLRNFNFDAFINIFI